MYFFDLIFQILFRFLNFISKKPTLITQLYTIDSNSFICIRVSNVFDYVFYSFHHYVPFLSKKFKTIYVSDTTYNLMIGYYYFNTSKWDILFKKYLTKGIF